MDICPDCGKRFQKTHELNICCPECKKKRKRESRRRCQARRRISRMSEPHAHGVEVIYCDGGADRYGKRTFLAWLQEGAFKPGDQYIMDGQKNVIPEGG